MPNTIPKRNSERRKRNRYFIYHHWPWRWTIDKLEWYTEIDIESKREFKKKKRKYKMKYFAFYTDIFRHNIDDIPQPTKTLEWRIKSHCEMCISHALYFLFFSLLLFFFASFCFNELCAIETIYIQLKILSTVPLIF